MLYRCATDIIRTEAAERKRKAERSLDPKHPIANPMNPTPPAIFYNSTILPF